MRDMSSLSSGALASRRSPKTDTRSTCYAKNVRRIWARRAENYLARLCRGAAKDLSAIGVELTQGPGLSGVDRRLVMRALLGIVLKSHWSASPGHRQIRLPKDI